MLNSKHNTKAIIQRAFDIDQFQLYSQLLLNGGAKAKEQFLKNYKYDFNSSLEKVLVLYGVEGRDLQLEFKKATNKHQFDREWSADVQRMRNSHFAIMGAIIEFLKVGEHVL